MDYALSHDEYHASTQILREHQWQRDCSLYWRQPTVFGPMPGPRQDFQGYSHKAAASSSSSVTATIKFKTSATLLRTLFPNSSYRFGKADTVALASFTVQTLKNMAWLAGGSYDLLGFYVHDVEYTTQGGETLYGSYCPVMFENLTDPILSGREELGLPKLFSDISISTGSEDGASTCEARIAWRGAQWAKFRWHGLLADSPPPPASAAQIGNNIDSRQPNDHGDQPEGKNRMYQGLFVHKCVPASDEMERGKHRVDAEYDVFIPAFGTEETSVTAVQKAHQAEFKIGDLGFNKLPTLHHIVGRLAEIPVFEIVEASIVEATGVSDWSGARKIE
jgi:Acetoacetate decarboxylase (ADC)